MAELAQPLVEAPERTAHKLRRDVGPVGLVFASLGSIIGAGWLFGALYASSLAGPAAIIAWLIGGSAMMLLALTHAELGSAYPVAGGNARFPHYAFGGLIGFTSGWVAFLGAVTVAPIMVQATLLYTSNYIPSLTTVADGRPVLTAQGYRCRGGAAAVLLHDQRHGRALACGDERGRRVLEDLRPRSYRGRTPRDLRPWRELHRRWGLHALRVEGRVPRACVRRCGLRLPRLRAGRPARWREPQPWPEHPARDHRRNDLLRRPLHRASGGVHRGARPVESQRGLGRRFVLRQGGAVRPFAGLATALGLGWLAVMLYTAAIVSPGATGLLYTGASARLSFALARNGSIPGAFARLTPQGTPLFAIAFSFLCGLVLFLPFPGWQQLVGFISAAALIAYGMVPLALGALRRQDPARPRPFRLPAASLVAPAAFVVASELLLFTGWAVVWKIIVAILIGVALLTLSILTDTNARTTVTRLAQCSLVLAVSARDGRDLVPQLVRHGDTELDPAARPSGPPQRAHLRLGHPRRRHPQPRRLRFCDPQSAAR